MIAKKKKFHFKFNAKNFSVSVEKRAFSPYDLTFDFFKQKRIFISWLNVLGILGKKPAASVDVFRLNYLKG